jgi:hypothetical protein
MEDLVQQRAQNNKMHHLFDLINDQASAELQAKERLILKRESKRMGRFVREAEMLCFFALDYKTRKRERERERERKRVVCFGHKAQAFFLFLVYLNKISCKIDQPPYFHANCKYYLILKRHAYVCHLSLDSHSFQVFWCYRNREGEGDFVSECLKMLLGLESKFAV